MGSDLQVVNQIPFSVHFHLAITSIFAMAGWFMEILAQLFIVSYNSMRSREMMFY